MQIRNSRNENMRNVSKVMCLPRIDYLHENISKCFDIYSHANSYLIRTNNTNNIRISIKNHVIRISVNLILV